MAKSIDKMGSQETVMSKGDDQAGGIANVISKTGTETLIDSIETI